MWNRVKTFFKSLFGKAKVEAKKVEGVIEEDYAEIIAAIKVKAEAKYKAAIAKAENEVTELKIKLKAINALIGKDVVIAERVAEDTAEKIVGDVKEDIAVAKEETAADKVVIPADQKQV
jgi:hypothetical protein